MNATEDMKLHAETIVASKDRFDVKGRNYTLGNWISRFRAKLRGFVVPERGWSAVHPGKFVMQALPFSMTCYDYSRMISVSVDPALIVSGTYKDYSLSAYFTPMPASEVMDRSDNLAVLETSLNGNAPKACKIGALPLYVALEGKNRVELFKQYSRPMKVLLTEVFYPAAADLRIYRSWPFGIYSLSYQGAREVLPIGGSILLMLRAYGVKDARLPRLSISDYFRWRNARIAICQDQMRD